MNSNVKFLGDLKSQMGVKMKKYDVVALGELLIDFTNNGESKQGNTLFEANPGGAPCNVLSMLNQLQHKTAFIGKVGADLFGYQLKETLDALGIDTRNLLIDNDVRTTLAFVKTLEGGDRDFSFYRNPGADMMLRADELDLDLLSQTKIFHFGSLSMTHPGVKEATKKAIFTAKEKGALISFDPNLREPLWTSLEQAKEEIAFGLRVCDIVKISDNEVTWFTGEQDYEKAIEILQREYQIPLILLSLGKDGSRAYTKDLRVCQDAFLQKNTIETTGAGDTFGACCLHAVLEHGISNLGEKELQEMLRFANAAASIITTRKGALRVMPTPAEVNSLL